MAKLFLSQCIRSGATVHMLPGDIITLVLPSGEELKVEITGDTTSITISGTDLFHERLEKDNWINSLGR